MPGADASRKRIIIRPETAFNEAPPANAATTRKDFTSESLTHKNVTEISDTIRGDLERSDMTLVGVDTAGDIKANLTYGNWDLELQAALGGAWATNVLKNGILKYSFGIERAYQDIGKFHYFRGMTVNTLEIDAESRKTVKLTVGYMGTRLYEAGVSVAGSTTPTEPNTNPEIAAGPTIQLFDEGGANIQLSLLETKSVKLNVNRNLRIRDVVTKLESNDFGRGARDISVTLNAYFAANAVYTTYLVNGFFALVFTMSDPLDDAKTYRVTLPRLKCPAMNPTDGGIESDVMIPVTAKAFYDAAVGYSIKIERAVDLSP